MKILSFLLTILFILIVSYYTMTIAWGLQVENFPMLILGNILIFLPQLINVLLDND